MTRYKQLVRCLKLAEMVRDQTVRTVNIIDYATVLNVSTRTIRRDIIALKEAGWPLVLPASRDKYIGT